MQNGINELNGRASSLGGVGNRKLIIVLVLVLAQRVIDALL